MSLSWSTKRDLVPAVRSARRRLGRPAARSPWSAAALLSLALMAACEDDDDDIGALDGSVVLDGSVTPLDGGAQPSSDGAAPATPSNALYAIATGVTVGESTTTYIKTLPALDTDVKIDLSKSLESPGFGDAYQIGGKLYVSSPETSVLRRFVVDAQGAFQADGEINFGAYSQSANIYEMGFISPTKAYLSGEGKWIVWNPAELKIIKTFDYPSSIGKREGMDPNYSFDRGFTVRGNRAYQAISWFDTTNYKTTPGSVIVVIDVENDAVLSLIEAPCPFLDVATQDDQQNVYFSGWVYSPGATLINNQAKSCAVKIPAGSDTIDPAGTLQMAAITGGHEASALTYIGNNKFLFTVFHEEKKPYNPATDKIFDWIFADSWRYATYDVVTREFKELTDLGWNSGGYYSARLSGRFYLLTPGAGYTDTTYLELFPDGTSKRGIHTDGWSIRAFQVR